MDYLKEFTNDYVKSKNLDTSSRECMLTNVRKLYNENKQILKLAQSDNLSRLDSIISRRMFELLLLKVELEEKCDLHNDIKFCESFNEKGIDACRACKISKLT